MNRELLMKYHFESGECETEFKKDVYIDWLEDKVSNCPEKPDNCQNCDVLSDAESKINELYDQLKDAESEIYDLQNQIDSL